MSQLCRVEATETFFLQPLGCYKDKEHDRALPDQYLSLRGSIPWDKLDLVVNQCAEKAFEIGYEYFAVQFHGVCYGRGTNYTKHGVSQDCNVFDKRTGRGVGRKFTNFVYRIKKTFTKLN